MRLIQPLRFVGTLHKAYQLGKSFPDSSFAEYLNESAIVDTEFALGMIDRKDFVDFNNAPNSDTCLEFTEPSRRAVTDTQAQDIVQKISHCRSVTEFQNLEAAIKESK